MNLQEALLILQKNGYTIFPPYSHNGPLHDFYGREHVKAMRQLFDEVRARRKTRGKITDDVTRFLHETDKLMESEIRKHLALGGISV